MNTHTDAGENPEQPSKDFFEKLWEHSWTYIKTVVDVAREPMVILDQNLRVMAANEPFLRTFEVSSLDTDGKSIYELGNGQWDIPVLHTMLEDILKKNNFFKGFQVAHDFPIIGRKVVILNARQIYIHHDTSAVGVFPPIILLAMEDVSEMMVVAESLAKQANQIESKFSARAEKMEIHIGKLEEELKKLRGEG